MRVSGLRSFALVLAIAAAFVAQTVPSSAHGHGGAIAAGIIGLALGAAVADSAHSRDTAIYGGPPPAYYGSPPPFSPGEGVTCYPARRQCYMPNGLLDWVWTDRVFPRY